MKAKDVAAALARDTLAVAKHLLPGGRAQGHEWVSGDVDGGPGKSLKVHLSGAKAGIWSDFAAGEGGDLLDLWAQTGNMSIGEALAEAKKYLGIEKPAISSARERRYTRPSRPAAAAPITQKKGKVEAYLRGERAITLETQKVFKIAAAAEWLSDDPNKRPWAGPWILFPYLRPSATGLSLLNIKWLHLERRDGKKQTLQEKNAEPCLFGWQAIAPELREVTICEGEIDAMSLWQLRHPALSVPAGGGSGHKHDWIETEWENLERFDTIYVCFDNDEAGETATAEVARRLGLERVKLLTLPHNDANDALVAGITQAEIDACYESAEELKPELLRPADDYRNATIEEFYPTNPDQLGIPIGLPKLADKFAWRYGELTIVTGINGHGKTIILSQLGNYVLDHGARACYASMEMLPQKLLERATRQLTLERKPARDRIDEAFDWWAGKLWFYAKIGEVDRTKMLDDFKYARRRYDCRFFVIDSLMRCGLAEDDYEGQKKFVDRLVDFCRDEDVHVVLVAHSRKPKDEHQPVGKLDVKGSGAITDLAFNCLTIRRNKRKEQALRNLEDKPLTDPDVHDKRDKQRKKPDAWLYIDKQRLGTAWEGRVDLWFEFDAQAFRDNLGGIAPRCSTLAPDQGALIDPSDADMF